jgi:ArsR family transcriptional regulator
MRDADFVTIARALADPTRHQIFDKIRARGQLTCSQVGTLCTQSQPTISHHLKALEKAGLINVRKEGQFHVLTADEEVVKAFVRRLAAPAAPRKKRTARSGTRPAR